MANLIDASALMILIKNADTDTTIELLQDSQILDLTLYEIGNAIWKETNLTKFLTRKETQRLGETAQIILTNLNRITTEPDAFQNILEIALTENLTYYDASYLHAAKQNNLQLVTEDQKLETKAQKHVNVNRVSTLIRTTHSTESKRSKRQPM
jgi:predicted nucleic acid-binding protein